MAGLGGVPKGSRSTNGKPWDGLDGVSFGLEDKFSFTLFLVWILKIW